jgi:hypothetical protein
MGEIGFVAVHIVFKTAPNADDRIQDKADEHGDDGVIEDRMEELDDDRRIRIATENLSASIEKSRRIIVGCDVVEDDAKEQ